MRMVVVGEDYFGERKERLKTWRLKIKEGQEQVQLSVAS